MTTRNRHAQVARRRERVAEAHLKGDTVAAIAEELAISASTVRLDLQALRKQWREARHAAMETARDVELAQLALLENECWSGWQRSQQQLVSEKLSKAEDEPSAPPPPGKQRAASPTKKRAERGTRSQHGDPRYLMLIMKCLERRTRLLSNDEPERDASLFSAQVTVREVLEVLSDNEDFTTLCRDRAALLEVEQVASPTKENRQ